MRTAKLIGLCVSLMIAVSCVTPADNAASALKAKAAFRDHDVSLRKGVAANGQDALIIENASEARLENIRVTVNRKDFEKNYAIGAKDTFYILKAQADLVTNGQRINHVGLHATVNGERKHFHWDVP
jgi:hypothetical protein